ncbi:MAG: thioredoxin family protein [Desulfobacterales bacterium]
MAFGLHILFAFWLAVTCSCASVEKPPGHILPTGDTEDINHASSKYLPVLKYDPKRDAATDIEEAILEARRTHRRVLVEVGGEWCIWCHILDRFFDDNRALLEYRVKHFVMVKVNYSPENKNMKVLSRYPKIPGYPHIFVLDGEGKLLHSQPTERLESGKGYSVERVSDFLRRWAAEM